jgi:2-keto-myo-inositol isomerase
MRPCLNQDTIKTTPTEEFIEIAKNTGFDAIELTMDKVEPILRRDEIDKLQSGVQKQGLITASINGPENFNLLSENEFSSILRRTKDLALAARRVGCDLLIPVPSAIKPGLAKEAIIAQTARDLSRLSDTCGDGIKLGLEFLGMRNCSINQLGDAIEVIRRVGRGNVGLVVDSFHMHLSRSSVRDLAKIKDKLFLVHVNDSEPGDVANLTDANRVYLGEGAIDLQSFRQALQEVGYDGFISLELLKPAYWEQPPEEVARLGRESLKRVFEI